MPGPDDAVRAQALLQEMHGWLLAGYAADAVIRAAAVVELALELLVAMPPGAAAGLGALIDELRRSDRTELLVEASWLYQHRITVEPLAGLVRAECDADGRRACAIASRIAQTAGLVTASQAAACEVAAAHEASASVSSALLRLDRASHRTELDDWLQRPPRVLVALIHGEVGQGHDHFAEIMACQLRSTSRGGWRELTVAWPPPSRSLGTRLAMLLDALAAGLGVPLGVPADDPATPDGARAWRPVLDRIAAAIDAAREPVLLRHTMSWLATRAGTDDALVDAYLRVIWATVAQRSGERVVVGLDVRRAERTGRPLTRTWWAARRELAVARAIARVLDHHAMPHGGVCFALPELTSIPIADLVQWLRAEGGRDRDTAHAEAAQLVASTRGGRFDLVIQRLT
ncbi:MAG TPA: hypothetical protein VF516_05890, partial [Kofleriaceae bacterium]